LLLSLSLQLRQKSADLLAGEGADFQNENQGLSDPDFVRHDFSAREDWTT